MEKTDNEPETAQPELYKRIKSATETAISMYMEISNNNMIRAFRLILSMSAMNNKCTPKHTFNGNKNVMIRVGFVKVQNSWFKVYGSTFQIW